MCFGGVTDTHYFRSRNNDVSPQPARIVPMNIQASSPVRVDLAGGWTDVGPYARDFGGEVVNFTINRRVIARSSLESADEEIEYEFQTPRGSGLGTSSAMNVSRVALKSRIGELDPEEIAEKAFAAESVGGNLCGRQDQWASALGGFNHLLFFGDNVEKIPFEPMKSAKNWLRKHLIIAYSGKSRRSGDMQNLVWGKYSAGDEQIVEGLHILRNSAKDMANGLQQDRRDLVVRSLRDVCKGVDMLDSSIHMPFKGVIGPLIEVGQVVAWKALGAGGGGCAAILCSPSGFEATNYSIENSGWEIIEWDFEEEGVLVEG